MIELIALLTSWKVYFWISGVISFICLIPIPKKDRSHEKRRKIFTNENPIVNVMTSAILGVAFGWFMWPIFVLAFAKTMRQKYIARSIKVFPLPHPPTGEISHLDYTYYNHTDAVMEHDNTPPTSSYSTCLRVSRLSNSDQFP